MKKILTTSLLATAMVATSYSQAIIYESFSQTAGALNGQASSGIGLTGNWSEDQTVDVVNPSTLAYGDLNHTGGQVNLTNGNSADVWVTTSSALSDAGLLADGATLWFSYVYKKSSHGGSNEHSAFGFTTSQFVTGASGQSLSAAGYGFGVRSNSNSLTAISYVNSTSRTNGTGSAALQDSTPLTPENNDGFGETLVIGKMVWNADSGLSDTLTVWTLALDDIATEPTTGGTTISSVILQEQLDTITFAQRNSGGTQTYDEIRFGASYADVSPVPEPSSFALLAGCFGLAWVMVRRRS